LPGTRGVMNSEIVVVANSTQGTDTSEGGIADATGRDQGRPHTTVTLEQGLNYSYRRDSVTIYGNVVASTQGETKREILGSGNAALALQRFPLKSSPMTYLPSPSAQGARDTLQLRVDGVLWSESPRLTTLTREDKKYIVETDGTGQSSIRFGDGVHGSRLPSGVDNVRAEYRTGLGQSGNVKARQISQLATRPLNVKEVVNPPRSASRRWIASSPFGITRTTRGASRESPRPAPSATTRATRPGSSSPSPSRTT
jgi:hypothetical protein